MINKLLPRFLEGFYLMMIIVWSFVFVMIMIVIYTPANISFWFYISGLIFIQIFWWHTGKRYLTLPWHTDMLSHPNFNKVRNPKMFIEYMWWLYSSVMESMLIFDKEDLPYNREDFKDVGILRIRLGYISLLLVMAFDFYLAWGCPIGLGDIVLPTFEKVCFVDWI